MHAESLTNEELAVIESQAMGRLFGCGIEAMRQNAGLSIEEAAAAAGMTTSEWHAIETGLVPEDWEQMHAMAEAMNLRPEQMGFFALVCHRAWQQ